MTKQAGLYFKFAGILTAGILFFFVGPIVEKRRDKIQKETDRRAREEQVRKDIQEGYRTGLFPDCSRRLRGQKSDLTEIAALPNSIKTSGDKIIGKIRFAYTIRGGGDLSPKEAALAYSAGVAAGFDQQEIADAVAKRVEPPFSYTYREEVDFAYNTKLNTCWFGPRVIDLDTGRVNMNSSASYLMNRND